MKISVGPVDHHLGDGGVLEEPADRRQERQQALLEDALRDHGDISCRASGGCGPGVGGRPGLARGRVEEELGAGQGRQRGPHLVRVVALGGQLQVALEPLRRGLPIPDLVAQHQAQQVVRVGLARRIDDDLLEGCAGPLDLSHAQVDRRDQVAQRPGVRVAGEVRLGVAEGGAQPRRHQTDPEQIGERAPGRIAAVDRRGQVLLGADHVALARQGHAAAVQVGGRHLPQRIARRRRPARRPTRARGHHQRHHQPGDPGGTRDRSAGARPGHAFDSTLSLRRRSSERSQVV